MKFSVKLMSAFVFSSISVQAFGGIWFPIPFVGRPIIVSGNPVHMINSGTTLSVLLPGALQYDEFGQVVNRLQRVTHFEVVVGPESTLRGCYPAAKSDGFRAFTSVNSPVPGIRPTTKVDTYDRSMPGDSRKWRVHRFEVNGGTETPVSQLNIFFPAAPTQIVPCHFQVNITNADSSDGPSAVPAASASAAPQSVQSAPTKASLPRLLDVPAVAAESAK